MSEVKKLLYNYDNNNQDLMKKLQAALEISEIGIWFFNEKLNTVYFSKSSKAIIGFEDDDTFGNHIDDWNNRVHPDDRRRYFRDYQNHINGKKPIYINKHRIKCKNGNYKWILDKGQIINDAEKDGYVHFVGTHMDITAEVEKEQKVTNALTIATKQNNRLKNFAHIVTHNLKEYSGNFESLLEFYDQSQTEVEKIELISHLKDVSNSLNKTIQNLNQIVSVESNKNTHVEKLNVSDFIVGTLKLLDVVIEESNAKVFNNVNPKLFVFYNSAYLESIIQNLLSNAIKYKHPERDPIIHLSSKFDGENILLTVSDNGIGVDLEKYGNDIFGLYKTFHHNENAEGVGLYLIKNQIESFGGKINISSKVNEGTTFTIKIPNNKTQIS